MHIPLGSTISVYAIRRSASPMPPWLWPIDSFKLTRGEAVAYVDSTNNPKRYRISPMTLIYRERGWFRVNALPTDHCALEEIIQRVYDIASAPQPVQDEELKA